MPFSQFSASPEHSQSGSQSQNQPTRAASTSGGKKGRKSRVASVAASPAVSSSDLLPGSSSVHWQTSLEDDLGASGSRAGTPSKQQRITGDDADEFPLLPEDLGSVRLSVIPGAPRGGGGGGVDDDAEPDEDNLPDMADDDYSAQLSWQSQSKDNLKVLMDNFSPEQYDRYEAYRRNALPKQAVRRVIQQNLGQQISTPVAQVVAGVAKVFVGEIVESARKIQARKGQTGPLSPDDLREAYREYQKEAGRVGAARPLRGKKLFVR